MDTEALFQTIIDVCIDIAWRLVAAALLLVVGRMLVRFLLKKIRSGKKFEKLDVTVRSFMSNFLNIGLYTLLAVIIVSVIGVPMASIITLFASAGAAVTLAVKGAFANFVGGIMLLIFKPFGVGEFVEIGGKTGTVEEVGFFYTQLKTADNITVSVPNGIMTDSVITNYSRKDTRRLDIALDVAYGTDTEMVKAVIAEVVEAHPKTLKDPKPFIRMTNMKDSALEFTLRVWCNRGDFGTLKSDLLETFDRVFAEKGIEVPFNQLDVNLTHKK